MGLFTEELFPGLEIDEMWNSGLGDFHEMVHNLSFMGKLDPVNAKFGFSMEFWSGRHAYLDLAENFSVVRSSRLRKCKFGVFH